MLDVDYYRFRVRSAAEDLAKIGEFVESFAKSRYGADNLSKLLQLLYSDKRSVPALPHRSGNAVVEGSVTPSGFKRRF
jgi:hypothetical protein